MKRALCIGINDYPGTNQDLSGCVNDASDWRRELESREFRVTSLHDSEATKSNMVEGIQSIVASTGRDDIAVITYSGHGTWVPDINGDEVDGRDEALCPYDINKGRVLLDDELYDIFSGRMHSARIIVISDSCHSGTVSRFARTIPGTEGDDWSFPKIRFLNPAFHLPNSELRAAERAERMRGSGKIRAASLLMSGCKDDEYSYDAWFNGRANGAFSYIALNVLSQLPVDASYQDWHRAIRQHLPHYSYPQTPQLQGSYYQRKWKVLAE